MCKIVKELKNNSEQNMIFDIITSTGELCNNLHINSNKLNYFFKNKPHNSVNDLNIKQCKKISEDEFTLLMNEKLLKIQSVLTMYPHF